jgi:hypothetical protein
MLLRSITKHVTDQNWFAVLLDLCIVILGILIGLQINEWRQNVVNKQKERAYLERMHEDILFSEQFANNSIERRVDGLNKGMALLKQLQSGSDAVAGVVENCSVPSHTSIQLSLPSLTSVNELLTTGQAGVLSSSAVRIAALELQQRGNLLARFQDQVIYSMSNMRDDFADGIRLETYFDHDDELRIKATCDFDLLRNNNRFQNAMVDNLDIADAFINGHLIPWSQQINRLHELLDETLGLSHEGNK